MAMIVHYYNSTKENEQWCLAYNSKSGILMVSLYILHIIVTSNLKYRFVFAE